MAGQGAKSTSKKLGAIGQGLGVLLALVEQRSVAPCHAMQRSMVADAHAKREGSRPPPHTQNNREQQGWNVARRRRRGHQAEGLRARRKGRQMCTYDGSRAERGSGRDMTWRGVGVGSAGVRARSAVRPHACGMNGAQSPQPGSGGPGE